MQIVALVCLAWAALVTGFLLGVWWAKGARALPRSAREECPENMAQHKEKGWSDSTVLPPLPMDDQWRELLAYDGKKPEKFDEEDEVNEA